MDTAHKQLRERLVALMEGRLPEDLGGEKCSKILYNLSAETASIAASLAQLAPGGRPRGNRQILFKSEDLPLLP